MLTFVLKGALGEGAQREMHLCKVISSIDIKLFFWHCYCLLRGDNPQLPGVHCHDSSSCAACLEEQEHGLAKRKDHPAWGCHFQGDMAEFWANPLATFRGRDGELYDGPLAAELGELTGKFSSQVEQVVSFLQKILYNIPF